VERTESGLRLNELPRARIVIVNYNGAGYIAAAIESALGQSAPCEVVVVDNASSDDSIGKISTQFPSVRIVQSPVNLGFGAGANLGASGCECEYVALLNPDAVATPQWIERITTWMSGRNVDFASSIVSGNGMPFFAGGRWSPPLGAALSAHRGEQTDWISGCALVARTRAFAVLNGFDPQFFLYCEDVDLCLRAREKEMRLRLYAEPLVHHPSHGMSTDRMGRGRKLCIAYASKGRLIRRHVRGLRILSAIAFQVLVSPAANGVSWRDYPAVVSAFLSGVRIGSKA